LVTRSNRIIVTWHATGVLAATDPWIRWDWISRHGDDITAALREHVYLTVVAMAAGLVISFAVALVARRWRWLQTPLLGFSGLLYTIPSLALFAFLLPITGLSRSTALIGLTSYTLLILTRNIIAGLDGVPPDVLEAATGMGYGSTRRLVRIELPLALPTIMAGIRIATVTTIGLVTVAALIGQGALGALIKEGIERPFRTPLVVGSVLSIALAIVADVALALLLRVLTPWTRKRAAP
jgi:osmoprotectant transport system permease protein